MAVHDSAFGSSTARENELLQVIVDIADQFFVSHLIYDVRLVSEGQSVSHASWYGNVTYAIEGGDEHARSLQAQCRYNVLLHPRYLCQWFLRALVSHNIIIRE